MKSQNIFQSQLTGFTGTKKQFILLSWDQLSYSTINSVVDKYSDSLKIKVLILLWTKRFIKPTYVNLTSELT